MKERWNKIILKKQNTRKEFIYKKYRDEKYFHIIYINLKDISKSKSFYKKIYDTKTLSNILDKIIYKQLYKKFKIKVKYFKYENDIILLINERDTFERIYELINRYINLDAIKIYNINKDNENTEIIDISRQIIVISEKGYISIIKKYGSLDRNIIRNFTVEKIYEEYEEYKNKKTDCYTGEIKVRTGLDNIDYEKFEKDIKHISESICKRIRKEKYFFSPFKTVDMPKAPYTMDQIEEARKNKAIRVLSIASITDVITQRLIYKSILSYCEEKFSNLKDDPSYGYRINRSAPMAIRKIYTQIKYYEYTYILDADIKKFFDEIPHYKLLESCEQFFGNENKLLLLLIKRFISVDKLKRINKKKKRIKHRKGIPQGGVLSGLLANIYLYELDKYIINELYTKYDNNIKYFRYADDFLVLSKDKDILKYVYEDIRLYMDYLELTIHELGPMDSKTKLINLGEVYNGEVETVEFLGFEISQNNIRIKKDNIDKFKNNFISSFNKYINKLEVHGLYPVLDKKAYNPIDNLEKIIRLIRYRVYGSLAFEMNKYKGVAKESEFFICKKCGGKIDYRGWLTYFSLITDIEQLKELDIWIRKQIYKEFYRSTKIVFNGKPIRLKKAMLKKLNTPSLEKFYYSIKKVDFIEKHKCKCEESELKINIKENLYIDNECIFLEIIRDKYCKFSILNTYKY